MKIELDKIHSSYNRIDSYTADSIIINGKPYTSSLIISPKQLILDWEPESFSSLATQHFDRITALEPEIIILGTGHQIHFPDEQIIAQILELNIGLETMDTGAACRCYNLLISEGRNVVAALLPINTRVKT